MKKAIHFILNKFGYKIIRNIIHPPIEYNNKNMFQGLRRAKGVNIEPSTIIDIGAASGSWSEDAVKIWKDSNFVLIEPLEEREKELSLLTEKEPRWHHVKAAAGKSSGIAHFLVAGDLDGSAVALNSGTDTREVKIVSVDEEIKKLNLKGPYLLKLDTHGFEVPILEGAISVLDETDLLIIECYGFNITESSLLFSDMCKYAENLGFRLFDLVDILRRPADGAFWQCDAFFIKKDNPVFQDNRYNIVG